MGTIVDTFKFWIRRNLSIEIKMGKPSGLRTARKLRTHRREQKWHDLQYKKSHLGTRWKANPFFGASHAKGIVLEKVGVEAKQPNSAIRKCVVCSLSRMGKRLLHSYHVTAA